MQSACTVDLNPTETHVDGLTTDVAADCACGKPGTPQLRAEWSSRWDSGNGLSQQFPFPQGPMPLALSLSPWQGEETEAGEV